MAWESAKYIMTIILVLLFITNCKDDFNSIYGKYCGMTYYNFMGNCDSTYCTVEVSAGNGSDSIKLNFSCNNGLSGEYSYDPTANQINDGPYGGGYFQYGSILIGYSETMTQNVEFLGKKCK